MGKQRIGILTHYYGSVNYGGCLQAYALTRVLNEMGYTAEQISYRKREVAQRYSPKAFVKKTVERILLLGAFKSRRRAFASFRDAIPHSESVYDEETVGEAADLYDAFITGSDQVWNFKWYDPAFFLDFVSGDKIKLSYAASLGSPTLSDMERKKMRESLRDFTAISVREREAISLLSDVTDRAVEWTLDPTLLLSRDKWDEVASERKVKGRYLFCYFLGRDKRIRTLATEYARRKGLKVVTLPHFPQSFVKNDLFFGDVRLYGVTPNDFISLVKNAECVFTDSFHAAVFSNLYEKEFFVFDRHHASEMSGRILTLLPLFGSEARFCRDASDFTLSHLMEAEGIECGGDRASLLSLVQKSRDFLKNAVENGVINE